MISQSTDKSLETVFLEVKKKFRYGIIVVRHEQTLPVDNVCSNLSLKHNLLYVSASRLIHEEIANCSEMGKKLAESRKLRELEKYGQFSDDENELPEYNPIHYAPDLVYELVNTNIAEKRTN